MRDYTWTSLSLSAAAIWDLSVRLRYFFAWNSLSSSRSCSDVKAVRRRLALLVSRGASLESSASGSESFPVETNYLHLFIYLRETYNYHFITLTTQEVAG
jgi:hypothetical protein